MVPQTLSESPGRAPTEHLPRVRRLVGFARAHWIEGAVFVVALVARLGMLLRRGGIHGILGYDAGVYFAGADALIHGRLPYRDFTMVHPPGITLALVPFAALTRWMSDWHAFVLASFAFCVLGAANAVLVVVVCRRFGLGRWAAGLAGLFYAVWFGSVFSEFSTRLEPLGNLFLLLGLLLLLRAQRKESGRTWLANVLAGTMLGLMLTVKIWWAVPVLLLVVWHGWTRRSVREALQVTLGAAISATVVCAPFFVADPSKMFASVLTDQLGRRSVTGSPARIFAALATYPSLHVDLSHGAAACVDAVFFVLVVAVLLLAWLTSKRARVMVVLVVVQLVVLFAAPSWYSFYLDYIAVGLAVCVGAAVGSAVPVAVGAAARTWREGLRLVPPLALTACALVVTTLITATGSAAMRPFAGAAELTDAVRNVKCVTAVSQTVLIRLDSLTRGLENGCPNWIDVTGHRFTLPDEDRDGNEAAWDRDLTIYLRSGGAVNLSVTPIPDAVTRAVQRGGVLATAGGNYVYWGLGD